MFFRRTEPLLLSEAGIHGLCASLNAPVVSIRELPVGPARAAILLHAENYGELLLTVAVRSLDTGQVAVFSYNEPVAERGGAVDTMDPALSFAEEMGFLFGDDTVGQAGANGRQIALREWQQLLGSGAATSTAGSLPPVRGASPAVGEPGDPSQAGGPRAGELLLEDPSAVAPSAQGQQVPPQTQLTKFRSPPTGEGVDGQSASELGRIRLVQRRSGSQVSGRSDRLVRLLGSF